MSQRALICVVILFCLNAGFLSAQAPTLDPSKTVDISTGKMGFALPLGTVKGNGLAYPLRLSYEAGIRCDQEASDVGLGFGLNLGCITRNVVNVPDDNIGPYSYDGLQSLDCTVNPSVMLCDFLCSATLNIISMITPGNIGVIINGVFTAAGVLGAQSYSQRDYRTGGYLYDWEFNTGVGFFKGGQASDYPDIYFVSTPFISGQLVWVGNASTGHFVFKNTGGSSKKGDETVKVDYTCGSSYANEVFRIRLADGTTLVFKKMDLGGNATSVWPFAVARTAGDFGSYCWFRGNILRQPDASPTTWWLTAVLSPDYVDGGGNSDDPLDATVNLNKGGWIGVTYNPITVDRNHCFIDMDMQTAETGTHETYYGDNADKIFQQIATIETANERAEFIYSDSTVEPRLDKLYINKELPVNFRKIPCLKGVRFLTRNNVQKSKVTFQTSYTLRPGSHHSYTDVVETRGRSVSGYQIPPANNSSAACLTLDAVSWQGGAGTSLQTTKFHYGKNPDASVHVGHPQTASAEAQSIINLHLYEHVEQKDVWGYYCSNPSTPYNITNAAGEYSKAINADAWSIDSISMPNGMAIKWEYEPNRYDRANGRAVTSDNAASSPKPPKYGGGIRVKSVTSYNGLGKKETESYFYTNTSGTFVENNGNSSGYTSVEPIDVTHQTEYRPTEAIGGIYTPSAVNYEKVQVVKGYSTTAPHTPNGYIVCNFTHAGDSTVTGYFPNETKFGKVDCSWKRGLLNSIAVYEKNGKLKDSTFNGNSCIDFDGTEGEWIGLDVEENRANGFETYGWVRMDSTVVWQNGVRKKTAHYYGDKTATSPDHVGYTFEKRKFENAKTLVEIPWYTVVNYPKYTRTATMTGIGGDPNKAIIFIAQGEYTAPFVKDDDVKVQAIHNVDLGANDLSDAQWSVVEEFSSACNNNDAGWLLTGLDVIAYDDASKNDLLFQFVGMDYVKLLLWPNVQVNGNTIVHGTPLFLRVMNGSQDAVKFTNSAWLRSIGWGEQTTGFTAPNPDNVPNTSAVCNLENSSSTIDILFYFSDPSWEYTRVFNRSNSNFHLLYIVQDIDLHNQTNWTEFGGTPIKKVPYDLSKSIIDVPTIQNGASGRYPFIGPHAGVVTLDGDSKQNDWIATDFYFVESEDRSYIEDAVIKNLEVQTSPFQIQFSLDNNLGKRIQTMKPENFNFFNHFNVPFTSKTAICGIVPVGNLTRRIYPFIVPGSNSAFVKVKLLSSYNNFTIAGDLDGQSNEIWSKAPQDKYLISKPIPAYWNYDAMKTANMLAQSCQTITYEKAAGDATPLSATDVRASQVTTWSPHLGSSAWVPNYSFAWNNQKGAYSDFVFPNPPADPSSQNPSWQYTGSVEKYNSYSAPVEVKNGKKISSATVYRNDLNIPIGSIANSKYDECAIFTCDYDMNVSSLWFDEPNGWKHYNNETKPSGAVCQLVSATPPHFGEKCLHVTNCQAAAKTIAVHSRTAKITYSAWVRPLDDKPIRFAACLVENGTGNNAVYYDYLYNTSVVDGTWRFVKFTIDISKPVSGTLPASFDGVATANGVDGIYVWVGNHPGDPGSDFYIEDIRIYPAKSLVTTTYYDSKWQQPILSVDANGNPSQKVEYDEFGRPVRWSKINKTTANLTLLQQKEYHLMGDFYAPNPNKWYKIVPEKDESFCIDIKDASWTEDYPVHLWTYAGALNQIWKFVPDGGNYKIESKGGGGTAFRLSARNLNDTTTLTIKSTAGGTQLWKLTDAGNGFCRISASTDDAKYIDLDNNDASNGGKVQIYTGGANTKWKLVEVP